MFTIRADDPTSPTVSGLIAHHLEQNRALMPPGFVYALDASALAQADTCFFTAWSDLALAGMGALRRLSPTHAEVKSMRTANGYERRGVARALLEHIAGEARARGYHRLSLETGTAPAYAPANALYEAFGFVDGPAFGGYPPSPHNRFMTLAL